jgi:hypothetical protein
MNEIDVLNDLRDEVPHRFDLRAEETRLLAAVRAGATAPRRRPVTRLRWGLALAAACSVAVAGVAVTQLGETGRPPVPGPPSTAMVLENAALAAVQTKADDIRPDQWFYIKESQHMGADLPVFEHWSRMDGEESATRVDGELRRGQEKGSTYPAKTAREVAGLPSDPDALLAHFRDLDEERMPLSICQPNCPAGSEGDVKAFGAIGWYMKFGPVIPPEKAAAMYRALAKIPNVTIEENTTDGDGRKGIGVVLTAGTAKGYYILDSADYRYLGVKVVDGGETVAMSVLDSGIVDAPGETP